MMTIVDNTALMGGLLSQCIRIASHDFVHFKYLTILFVNETSSKAEKKLQSNKN